MGSKRSAAESRNAIFYNQCRYLTDRYPALQELGIEFTHANAKEVFAVFCWQVRRMDPHAGVLDYVEFLEKTIRETKDAELRQALQLKLFAAQAARGLVHKVLPLLSADDPLRGSINQLLDEHHSYYGVDPSRHDLKDTSRGASIRLYFSEHPELLANKRVLHFAPETGLRTWMNAAASRLRFTYETADGFVENVDHSVDLCALPFPDASYDVVIIHRVLEHVIDGGAALRELHRVLSPDGLLNISVPESLYLPKTADWRVPDPRLHMHVRVYGRDFPLLLLNAGFRVDRCEWLLRQPAEKLRAAQAYPMSFHNAFAEKSF